MLKPYQLYAEENYSKFERVLESEVEGAVKKADVYRKAEIFYTSLSRAQKKQYKLLCRLDGLRSTIEQAKGMSMKYLENLFYAADLREIRDLKIAKGTLRHLSGKGKFLRYDLASDHSIDSIIQ